MKQSMGQPGHIRLRMILRCLICIALLSIAGLLPSNAYAAAAEESLADCADNGGFTDTPGALTEPIIDCFQFAVENAVVSALDSISTFFKPMMTLVFVLAIIMHGASMMTGERGITPKSIVLMLKIVFAYTFVAEMGAWASYFFGIMDEVRNAAIGGSPWHQIDQILGTIVGFAPGVTLAQGLLWLASAISSGTTNFGMSFSFIVAFIELILFVIEIVYVYLSAYIVVAFMLILSPMFVPLIVFRYTERLFSKWLDTIIGAMLIPVMVFAALSFALDLFLGPAGIICNVFTAMLPPTTPETYVCAVPPTAPKNVPDFTPFLKIDEAVQNMNFGEDTNFYNDLNNGAYQTAPGNLNDAPAAHTVINPFYRGGFDDAMHPPGVNFGKHNKTITARVMMALITLWLYVMVLKQLIEAMPEVAQEMAGAATGIVLRAPSFQQKVAEIKSDFTSGAGMILGAAVGRAGAEAAVAKPGTIAKEAGAIAGGILGDVLARKAL